MELLLGIMFVACFMVGAVQVLAFLMGAFAITAGWLLILLFCFLGIVLPMFIFTTLFASFPVATGILVICLAVWAVVFILKKDFAGIKFCIDEIKRYLDERRYNKYK